MMEAGGLPSARIPVSTYRLQFSYRFGFSDALKIVPYLHELGITDIYASPYLRARKESLHGYDIVDSNNLNPEVGTEEEYDRLIAELQRYDMGQIADIVPNHMCNESDNMWWTDVLENGPASVYADFFDINWTPDIKKLTNKILIPFLGDQYGKVLERQELKLVFEKGSFCVDYYGNRFPILPGTYNLVLGHRIEELKESVPENNPGLVELLSIITAVKNLPLHTEKDPARIRDRYREKEVIKKRLSALCDEDKEMRGFIHENIRTFNGVEGDPGSFDLLDGLLSEQVWRLSFWQVATEEVNYRRFFDINNIAALHMENPGVFREFHKLILRLVSDRKITGLRIDHADGLYDPCKYFQLLQRSCFVRLNPDSSPGVDTADLIRLRDRVADVEREFEGILSSDPDYRPFYIIAEKVLMRGEKIPEDWSVFGTTGYIFLNLLNGIFVDAENAREFDALYSRFTGQKITYQDTFYEKKKLVMQVAMSGEISTLGNYLYTLSEKSRHTRDFTMNSLTRAITEIIAFFPVYRTYTKEFRVSDRDRQYVELSVSKAKRKNPAISSSVFDFIRDVLLLRLPEIGEQNRAAALDFVMKVQQITGPVMAKGLEDTAFYVYNRLVSLNEVGGSPDRFGSTIEAFHGQNIERHKYWPYALVATSTHDTKRGEDVRARINVLSEMPGKWRECVMKWARLNKKKKVLVEGRLAPDRYEEYLLYQTLIGAWPAAASDDAEYETFRPRIREYMIKAIREAKVNTSWINPDTAYEAAVLSFVDRVLEDSADNLFFSDFVPFQRQISHYGMLNSLSQILLKITSPGVPDFYQGTEIWDYSLVDPDNRRLVDYDRRMKLLQELKSSELAAAPPSVLAHGLTARMDDGKIKLYLLYKALRYRKGNRSLFEFGKYVPLETVGTSAYHVCAFARKKDDAEALIVAPRFYSKLISPGGLPLGKKVWQDTAIVIPFEKPGVDYRNLFTGESLTSSNHDGAAVLYLSDVLSDFPVALMSASQHVEASKMP